MHLNAEQAKAITSAVWLVGLGILITTGAWWPGILFLIGAGSVARAIVEGQGRSSWHAGFWAIVLGVIFLAKFQILAVFVAIAVAGLVEAFAKSTSGLAKPEPDAGLIDDRI